ncbi:hypothetical protein [Idiomarina ramblicola]|uniref:Uncharacterized protein n=1 Tax=Idiomarina ramblicola TaxID=263724 RepID=A0A432Z5S0_9GAMM|nr:hypothetical protein [Idiomarina ramblicola]RUO73241.1 hypothetical protein CWI78_02000 [Idiomarina ramblicola]
MTNTYKSYFNSQQQLKTATSLLNRKDYESAVFSLRQARESAQDVSNDPVLAGNAIQNYTTCSILLIATHIRRHQTLPAYELQQESIEQLRRWQKTSTTEPLKQLCRYCCQLLITGCQHSRCLGHCLQQLEESGYAQEQT